MEGYVLYGRPCVPGPEACPGMLAQRSNGETSPPFLQNLPGFPVQRMNAMSSPLSVIRVTMALLAVLALIAVPAATAQTTGKIAGTVTDASNGQGLPGVNVVIVGTTTGAVTDADGDYFIINVSPGAYDVQASSIGFVTTTVQHVEVFVDQTTTIDFDLGEEVAGGRGSARLC